MSHTVKAVFTFKDHSSRDKFIDFCNGPRGLDVTRGWDGCVSIDCYEVSDNPLEVVIWQKWKDHASHESYVKFRHDDGSFDFLGELISSPPVISGLRPLVFKNDEEQIRDVVHAMCNKDHTVGMRHCSDDCIFIRPTGNPLTMKQWDSMMGNSAVSVELQELVSIHKLRVVGNMAYVVYTNHGKFTYMGTENDDIAVLTCVLERVNGRWVAVHGQRSTGRSPSAVPPKFD